MIKNTTVIIHSPIYSWITSGYAVGALINLLMTEMKCSQVCTVRLHGVCENATLVIDLDEVIGFVTSEVMNWAHGQQQGPSQHGLGSLMLASGPLRSPKHQSWATAMC